MKVIPFAAAACLTAGVAVAQPATNPPNSTAAPANTTGNQSHNPAVATTSNANDSVAPAKGSNSFTEGQAKDRIAQRGYTNLAELKKDNDGVWRGTAQHGGKAVQVWLDYKGNVGEAR